jgi:hypothetical protein
MNSESEDDSMFYLFSTFLNSLFTALHMLANWPRHIIRRTYNDNDNTFIHLFTVLPIAGCCEFPSCQLTKNDAK